MNLPRMSQTHQTWLECIWREWEALSSSFFWCFFSLCLNVEVASLLLALGDVGGLWAFGVCLQMLIALLVL